MDCGIFGRDCSADGVQQGCACQTAAVIAGAARSNADAVIGIAELGIVHHRRSDSPGPLADDALGRLYPVVVQSRECILTPVAGVVGSCSTSYPE